ncbi:MAG TPA: hypothetical protein VMU67_00800 [Steroidobacteraceae bacterium]|nr:hypothetical protein [Steroidobacteraceae bacterium]
MSVQPNSASLRAAELAFVAGREHQGAEILRSLTTAEPLNARLWHGISALAARVDRPLESVSAAEAAVLLAPISHEYRLQLADALLRMREIAGAMTQYEIASFDRPDDARIAAGRAAALDALRPARELPAATRAAAERLFAEGERLQSQGKQAEALEAFLRLARLLPWIAPLHYRIAGLLQDSGQADKALSHYELAARLQPDLFGAMHNAGKLAASLGHVERACRYLSGAHRLRPGDGINLRLELLLGAIHDSADGIAFERARYERGLDRLLEAPPRIEDPLNKADLPTFYLAYHGLCNRELNVKLARVFAAAAPELTWSAPHCIASARRPGRIRIGFISRFLRTHSVGKVARGLIANLGPERFERYVLNIPPVVLDETARSIRAHCDHWLTLPDSLEAARTQIAALELDILFYQDIGMEPFSYLLAFARLAKVQCVSFGHPDTTGIATMDYWLSTDVYEPRGASAHYSERLVELHALPTLSYYFRPQAPQRLPRREELGLPSRAHLYICPQTLFKLHPDFDGLVRRILEQDGDGRVVLFTAHCAVWSAMLQRRFRRTMGELSERIQFLPRQSYARFLQLLGVADVVLDTPHFNGMNTSLDAFSVGTPVVTMPAALQRGRFTQAMYQAMEIDDCVASDADRYAALAVDIAGNRERRHALGELIRQRSHRLFEDRRALDEFERFFLASHQKSIG